MNRHYINGEILSELWLAHRDGGEPEFNDWALGSILHTPDLDVWFLQRTATNELFRLPLNTDGSVKISFYDESGEPMVEIFEVEQP